MKKSKQEIPNAMMNIEGVSIHPLRQIPDERGKIMHMLRSDDKHFEKFGEIYFSVVNPHYVKAWHIHKAMTLNYAVVHGEILLVVYDDRVNSKTRGTVQQIRLGESHYALVRIPSGVWNGFKGLAPYPSIVANCATLPHDPNEIIRIDPYDLSIPFNWKTAVS